MNRNRNTVLAVAILSLLTTCCLCPLGINALGALFGHIRRRPLALGWYARLLGRITPDLPGYVLNLQVLCAGVILLVITVLSFMVYFRAREPKAEAE